MISMKILILFFWLVSCQASAGGVVVDKFVRAIDGDTIVVDVYAWPRLFGDQARVRLRGVDTPEIRGKCKKEKLLAYEAKVFVASLVGGALGEGGRVVLVNLGRGTFFRVVADVVVDGVDLGEALVLAGLARKYSVKEGRKSWCN